MIKKLHGVDIVDLPNCADVHPIGVEDHAPVGFENKLEFLAGELANGHEPVGELTSSERDAL